MLQERALAAAQQLQRLIDAWDEPDSLRVFRAKELIAICQGLPARIAALPTGEAGEPALLEMGQQLAMAEGFARDHLAQTPAEAQQRPVLAEAKPHALDAPVVTAEGPARLPGSLPAS